MNIRIMFSQHCMGVIVCNLLHTEMSAWLIWSRSERGDARREYFLIKCISRLTSNTTRDRKRDRYKNLQANVRT